MIDSFGLLVTREEIKLAHELFLHVAVEART
jgi:hypothetical protein